VRAATPSTLRAILRSEFVLHRKLDTGNPNPGSIGSDFNRLGLSFWNQVERLDARNKTRKIALDELNLWRNAIAHQDFDPKKLGSTTLQLNQVRAWRSACNGLATMFDQVMASQLQTLTGATPW
jgi:hypothetical protein